MSERNQKIVSDYIDSFRDVGKGLSQITVKNNIHIMIFVLKNVSADLDKLTRADVKQYKRAVDDEFYRRYNIPSRMEVVNKILYDAAGCGSRIIESRQGEPFIQLSFRVRCLCVTCLDGRGL